MDLSKLSDKTILAAYGCAKTRLLPFFRDPKAMIKLREEAERRRLVKPGPTKAEFCEALIADCALQRLVRFERDASRSEADYQRARRGLYR